MRRLLTSFLGFTMLALAIVALMIPAEAVTEPTASVTGLVLRVSHYATATQADCVGGVFPFNRARISPYVSVEATPSEHFSVKVTVFSTSEKKRAMSGHASL